MVATQAFDRVVIGPASLCVLAAQADAQILIARLLAECRTTRTGANAGIEKAFGLCN